MTSETVVFTLLNILIIESAAFTLSFVNNSRRILSFVVFLLSISILLTYIGAEFFAIILVCAFIPIIFILFMLCNMVREKKEKYIKTKVAIFTSIFSALITVSICIVYPYHHIKNTALTDINLFLAHLYEKHSWMIIATAAITFITVLINITLFFDGKKQEEE